MKNFKTLDIRPYQLMCIVCKIGEGISEASWDKKFNKILKTIRNNPNIPVRLRCNVDTVYKYQNPGREDDTPEGKLFNDKRDLDIIQKLGIVPGSTRPALELFNRLFKEIISTKGICGYDKITSKTWRGCKKADSGNYEKGHARGVNAVIPPRGEEEKEKAKKKTVKDIYKAKTLFIRPHHLMCMTCFHGGKKKLAPIKEDNLFEAIDIIQKNSNIPITLIPGCCMICPPCSRYEPETNLCVGAIGIGLRDQKKDLDLLQKLGLKYGDTLPAKKIYKLLFEKIHSTVQICGYSDGIVRGQEWTICRGGPEGSKEYVKGRRKKLGISELQKK